MLQEGLVITVVGMGTVLVFLTILVFAMSIMSKVVALISRIMPEEVEAPVAVRREINIDEEVAVAIAVAKMNMN